MAAATACDVLVVGGGPTGMTLGLLLARRGVDTVVIDKEPVIYRLPRAAHIDHEIMRIFQELGVADSVMASTRRAARYDFLTADRQVLMRFEGMDRVGPGGWPASNMIHQPSIEAALRAAAPAQPKLQLKTGWNWQSFVEEADRLVSTVATPEGNVTVASRFVVGADGARSRVRAAAGIAIDDLGFDEQWLVIDVLVHDASRLPDANLQICDPVRPTTCVLMGSGRHRWEFMLKPGETAEQILDDAFIARLLAPWNVEGAVTLERKAVYRFNARVAKEWRKGRILLAGDAAHQTPPFAGQGLCAGLRDAANLGWKIPAVLAGASPSLLDSYQTEREPHARSVIGLAMMMGRTVCITDPSAAKARDDAMLADRAAGRSPDGAVPMTPLGPGALLPDCAAAGSYFPQFTGSHGERLDDVLGAGAWLISVSTSATPSNTSRSIAIEDPLLAPFREPLAAWLKAQNSTAVLIRPDRYIFGTADPEALARAWRDNLSAS